MVKNNSAMAYWQNFLLVNYFYMVLPEALILAKNHKDPIVAGGPAVSLMPDFLSGVAIVNQPCPVDPLLFHNPLATFTTRGCPNTCEFCAVPKIEGHFQELTNWRLAPLICDNNFLASSKIHFDQTIDRLKSLSMVDFNQGLDARLIKPYHASSLAELKKVKMRFAFDHVNQETQIYDSIKVCKANSLKDFSIYCLIGWNDDPATAQYRLETVKKWGAATSLMRFQPLDTLKKIHMLHLAGHMKNYKN
jgi:hypothetical protein